MTLVIGAQLPQWLTITVIAVDKVPVAPTRSSSFARKSIGRGLENPALANLCDYVDGGLKNTSVGFSLG